MVSVGTLEEAATSPGPGLGRVDRASEPAIAKAPLRTLARWRLSHAGTDAKAAVLALPPTPVRL